MKQRQHTTDQGVAYDRQDQLQQIESGLLQGERLYAVYDCKGVGTGFMAMTDRRVILQDKSFIGRHTAIISVPYTRIYEVAVVSDKSWAGQFFSSSSIAFRASSQVHEATFWTSEKAHHAHNLILWHVLQGQ